MIENGFLEIIPWMIQQLMITVGFTIICHGKEKLGTLSEQRRQFRSTVIEGITLYLILSISGPLLAPRLGVFAFLSAWKIIQGILFALYLWKCCPFRQNTKVILWGSMFAGFLALSSLSGLSSYMIGILWVPGISEAIMRGIVHLFIPLLAVFLARFNFDDCEYLPPSAFKLILATDLSLIIVLLTEFFCSPEDLRSSVIYFVTYLVLLFLLLVEIYVVYSMCKSQESLMLLREEAHQLKMERERYFMAKDQMDEIRSIRHDLKNQRHYMSILISQERYEELEHFFAESKKDIPVPEAYVKCGNNSVNVILNMEIAKIDEGIDFDSLLVVPPVLPFSEEELCSVLTNLLDNAIEECRRIKEKGINKPQIRLEIYPEANYLLIRCENTTDKSELDYWKSGIKSSKGDYVLHGYGTQIVSRIAEKYNGCAEYSLCDDGFVAKIMMDMSGEKKSC